MKVRDLRKKRLYITARGELCRYAGKVRGLDDVHYCFDVSTPSCDENIGAFDRLGIYYVPLIAGGRSHFIRTLSELTPTNLESVVYVGRGVDDKLYIYDHGIKREFWR